MGACVMTLAYVSACLPSITLSAATKMSWPCLSIFSQMTWGRAPKTVYEREAI